MFPTLPYPPTHPPKEQESGKLELVQGTGSHSAPRHSRDIPTTAEVPEGTNFGEGCGDGASASSGACPSMQQPKTDSGECQNTSPEYHNRIAEKLEVSLERDHQGFAGLCVEPARKERGVDEGGSMDTPRTDYRLDRVTFQESSVTDPAALTYCEIERVPSTQVDDWKDTYRTDAGNGCLDLEGSNRLECPTRSDGQTSPCRVTQKMHVLRAGSDGSSPKSRAHSAGGYDRQEGRQGGSRGIGMVEWGESSPIDLPDGNNSGEPSEGTPLSADDLHSSSGYLEGGRNVGDEASLAEDSDEWTPLKGSKFLGSDGAGSDGWGDVLGSTQVGKLAAQPAYSLAGCGDPIVRLEMATGIGGEGGARGDNCGGDSP